MQSFLGIILLFKLNVNCVDDKCLFLYKVDYFTRENVVQGLKYGKTGADTEVPNAWLIILRKANGDYFKIIYILPKQKPYSFARSNFIFSYYSRFTADPFLLAKCI
jgi:hypothetical protein